MMSAAEIFETIETNAYSGSDSFPVDVMWLCREYRELDAKNRGLQLKISKLRDKLSETQSQLRDKSSKEQKTLDFPNQI